MSEPRSLPTSHVQNDQSKKRKNKKKSTTGETITIDGKQFKKIRMLGKGAYGKVFKVKDDEENYYAVKKVDYKEHEGVYPDIIKEMDFLRRFSHHPNIIELCGWKWDSQVFAALMEYGGSPLHKFIAEEDFKYRMELLPEVLWQMLNGLAYIHSKNVVHRDLKPDNILIDEWIIEKHRDDGRGEGNDRDKDDNRSEGNDRDKDGDRSDEEEDNRSDERENIEINVKLVDFGLSKQLTLRRNTPKTSTLWYRAPENLTQLKEYDCKIDVWAVGCIIYEYYTGDVLFRGEATKDTLIRVLSTLGPKVPENTLRRLNVNKSMLPQKWKRYRMKPIDDKQLEALMMRCLELHPDKRPSVVELLNDLYFTSKGYVFNDSVFNKIDQNAYKPDDKLEEVPAISQTLDWVPLTKELHREIIEWMFHISAIKYVELEYETVFLGIELFERVIRKWTDQVNNISEYKYISLACLDIASKFFEVYSIELEWVYEYNNKEHFKEQHRRYKENPLSFQSPPKLPEINKGDLRAFVIRINRYEKRILYLLDFCVHTPSLFVKTHQNMINEMMSETSNGGEINREKLVTKAKQAAYDRVM